MIMRKKDANKIFLTMYLESLSQEITCGGSGGGGTTWKKC